VNRQYMGALSLTLSLFISGCAHMAPARIRSNPEIENVCIIENPDIPVPNFLSVLRKTLKAHGVSSEVYPGGTSDTCKFVVTYTGMMNNFKNPPYMSSAEVDLSQDGKQIARSGYNFATEVLNLAYILPPSPETKMNAMVEQLLTVATQRLESERKQTNKSN
jgi:hypothetical protein